MLGGRNQLERKLDVFERSFEREGKGLKKSKVDTM